ncbi:hypothetical protein CRUP_023165 [Coryphaenoides rupestris]|nr:hypothetical protein CRUP_023165 [Coryphaenoides rupestris]
MKTTEYNISTRKSVAENVCDETADLYLCLEDAGIPVSLCDSKGCRNFLHTFTSPDSSCQIGKLPCRLQQSNYKLFHSLKLLVDYCFKEMEVDEIKIQGLPLLLTRTTCFRS